MCRNGEMRGGTGMATHGKFSYPCSMPKVPLADSIPTFSPCFFTNILWSGFASCDLDSILDPRNPQSMFRRIHDRRLGTKLLAEPFFQELLSFQVFLSYPLDCRVDINLVVMSPRLLLSDPQIIRPLTRNECMGSFDH